MLCHQDPVVLRHNLCEWMLKNKQTNKKPGKKPLLMIYKSLEIHNSLCFLELTTQCSKILFVFVFKNTIPTLFDLPKP